MQTVTAQKFEYARTVEMTADEWIALPDNGRQRNTAVRALKALHLLAPLPLHNHLDAALLPDGSMVKADGHTRAYLWKNGSVPKPDRVFVRLWRCVDEAEERDLYTFFDNQHAVETTSDKLYGAMRENEIKFISDLLSTNRFSGGLRIASELYDGHNAYSKDMVYRVFRDWMPEFQMLDEVAPKTRKFQSPIIASALLTFKLFGSAAQDFWGRYQQGLGDKTGGRMDAVQALDERYGDIARQGQFWGAKNRSFIVRLTVAAYQAHVDGVTFTEDDPLSPITAAQLKKLIENARKR